MWQEQSLRKGGASAASAAGASLPKIRYIGGWAKTSAVPEDVYIDPTCPASREAHEFFDFLV